MAAAIKTERQYDKALEQIDANLILA